MVTAVLFDDNTEFVLDMTKKVQSSNKVKIVTATRDFSELETILKKDRADILIFGPSLMNEDMISFAQLVSAKYPYVGIILISSDVNTDLLRDGLRAGVKDVLPVTATSEQIVQTILIAYQSSQRICRAVKDHLPESAVEESTTKHSANVLTFFGAKGGVGTSFIATNVAVGLARQTKSEVIILDLDLQFGDVAVMLRLKPVHTMFDVVSAIERLDADMMKGFLSTHTSGLKALLAPVLPDKADAVSSEDILKIIDVLKGMCDYLIVDTPTALDDRVLVALDNADQICVVTSLDVPSLKDTKLSLNMMQLLRYPKERIKLVLNRANSKVKLSIKDVENSLETRATLTIPSNIIVPLSVNKGIPVIIDSPKAPVARSLFQFIDEIKDGQDAAIQSARHRMEKA